MRFFKKRSRESKADRLETYIAGLIIVQNNLATQIGILKDEINKLRKYQSYDAPASSYALVKKQN